MSEVVWSETSKGVVRGPHVQKTADEIRAHLDDDLVAAIVVVMLRPISDSVGPDVDDKQICAINSLKIAWPDHYEKAVQKLRTVSDEIAERLRPIKSDA